MDRILRFLPTQTTVLGPDTVQAVAGTSGLARDGHQIVMAAMDFSGFLKSGTILWNHNSDYPVGIPTSCRVDAAGNLQMTIDFAPEGISARADEVRRLVKAGIIRSMSVGFRVLEAEPLDARNPRSGKRLTRTELLETSFVSVPADTNAMVTARLGHAEPTVSPEQARRRRQVELMELQSRLTDSELADWDRRKRQAEALARVHHETNPDIRHRHRALAPKL